MKDVVRRNTGIISALLALVLVLAIYTLLGTVDLVFMDGDFQVARMEDVRVFSSLELDPEEILSSEELEFTYGKDAKPFEADISFRIEIAKTLIVNLFTFKWEDADQVIVLTAK